MSSNNITYNHILPCSSFREFVERIECLYGNRIAFRNYSESWSYHDLYTAVRKLTAYFSGVDIPYIWIDIGPSFYFTAAFFAATISGKVVLLSPFDGAVSCSIGTFTEADAIHWLDGTQEQVLPQANDPDALAVIAQSSGTTSVAKGVMLSQKNLLSDTIGGMTYYDYPLGAVYYHILPYSHLFGIVAELLGPLYSGGTICFSDNKLNFFKDMQYFQPTHMNLPPALVYAIEKMLLATNDPTAATGGRLQKIMCAGAALNEQSRVYMRSCGIHVFPAYGLTECSPCVSMNSDLFMKPGSVGKILPCCEVSILDGEIAVRGDNVMLGYWNDPEATANTIRNGWLYTGDMGYIDREGFLFLTGRKTNIIVFEDGTKIMPEIIETAVNRIDGIDECLVAKTNRDNRVFLHITAVCSEGNETSLRTHITHCLDEFGLFGRVGSVVLQQEPLPKNKLGKIIRNK